MSTPEEKLTMIKKCIRMERAQLSAVESDDLEIGYIEYTRAALIVIEEIINGQMDVSGPDLKEDQYKP